MNKETVLKEFGLTEAEIKVYLALLSTGESTASGISRLTAQNRTFTYDRLRKLGNMGLVSSVIKDNKKYFIAAEPKQLISIMKEREEKIQIVLPELEKLRKPPEERPEVEVYSGLEGVKTALSLILRDRKAIHLHGTVQEFEKSMDVYFNIWNKRRIKNKIDMYILSSEPVKLERAKSELLSKEEKSQTTSFVFGDKTLTIRWGDHPVAVLITSKEIAKENLFVFKTIP